MDPNAFYTYGTETPSSSFPDWVGVPGSPSASNLVLMGLGDAPAIISSFDQDVDDALGNQYDAMASFDFACQLDPVIDWQSVFNDTMPFPPPALTDDISSTSGSSNLPLSPASDSTLVNPQFPSHLPEFKLPPPGDALVDQPATPSSIIFDNFAFTFEYDPTTAMPPFDPSTALLQQGCYYDYYDYSQGQCWPGQQPSQHSVGAAGAVAPGLATGVEVNADTNAFTVMAPASVPPLPTLSPEPQQDLSVADEKVKPVRTARKRTSRVDSDADSNYSAGESNAEDDASPRKKRRQDNTKRFPCPYEGCDMVFSRTHNREVHVKDVHHNERGFVCTEPGCPRAFKRNHDLKRHHQSAHTTLGSPRNAKNPNNAKGAKGRKVVKKVSHDI